MSKHTPGPWYQDPKYPLTIRPTIDGCPVANVELVSLGRLYGAYGNKAPVADEAKANARLIAAAPDLLAACQAAELILDCMGSDSHSFESLGALALVREAIAKAEDREGE